MNADAAGPALALAPEVASPALVGVHHPRGELSPALLLVKSWSHAPNQPYGLGSRTQGMWSLTTHPALGQADLSLPWDSPPSWPSANGLGPAKMQDVMVKKTAGKGTSCDVR